MKKICCILLLILVCSLFLLNPVASFAQEPTVSVPDYTTIPDDILAQMDLTGSDRVIRCFAGSPVSRFADESKSIEDHVKQYISKDIRTGYYLVMREDQVLRIYCFGLASGFMPVEKDGLKEMLIDLIYPELIQQESIKRVAEDIVVNASYFFMEYGYGSEGCMIYYDTNYGPYVLYDCINQYLMPFSVYQSMAQDFIETRYNIPSGFASITLIEDFDQKYGCYDLNSKDFFLNPTLPTIVWVVVAIVPVAAALGIGWYVKKQKHKKEVEL